LVVRCDQKKDLDARPSRLLAEQHEPSLRLGIGTDQSLLKRVRWRTPPCAPVVQPSICSFHRHRRESPSTDARWIREHTNGAEAVLTGASMWRGAHGRHGPADYRGQFWSAWRPLRRLKPPAELRPSSHGRHPAFQRGRCRQALVLGPDATEPPLEIICSRSMCPAANPTRCRFCSRPSADRE
jgi:hypothetical protein